MKKVIPILNIVFSLLFCTLATLSLALKISWLNTLASIMLISICAFNVVYALKTKTNNKLIFIANFAFILVSFIAIVFVKSNFILCASLLAVAQLTLITALNINNKPTITELYYIVAIALPTLLTFILAPLFGYSSVLSKIFILLYVLVLSTLVAKTLSNFVNNKNLNNIILLIASLVLFVFNVVMLLIKLSNVSFKFEYVFYVLFYLTQLLFAIWLFINCKQNKTENINNKSLSIKQNIKRSVFTLFSCFIICFAVFSSLFCLNIASAKITKNQFLELINNQLNIPLIEISTQNNQMPFSKEDYVNCSFSLSNCKDEDHNFSVKMANSFDNDYDNANSVGIRLRGNSTRFEKKRPYRIKFEEKQSLFGLTKNKSWVLLADYYDQSYIRNFATFSLADNFDNLDFSPTPHHVALVINNEFKGLYLLCEQMDENKGRANVKDDFDVSIDTEFPFLVEMDLQAHKEGVTGIDNFYVQNACPVEIKFPESDERQRTAQSDIVFDYINEYINAVFKILNTGEKVNVSFRNEPVGLEDLVDIDSAVDYYLITEIMLNPDSTMKSIYMHKTKDGKLKFGPIWDFDYSMATKFDLPYTKSYIEDTNTIYIAKHSVIFKHLIKDENFYNKVTNRYNSLKNNIVEVSNSLKDYKATIDSVAKIDSKMWHGTTGEFQFGMQYDYARLFLLDRANYLEQAFSNTHTDFLALI